MILVGTLAALSTEDLRWFGRFHLIVLHLPIGLFALLAVLEVLVRFGKDRAGVARAASVTLAIATASALLTVVLGLMLGSSGGYAGAAFELHRNLGIGFAVLAVLMAAFRNSRVYLVMLFLALLMLVPVGHYGGVLVHGSDYLSRDAPDWLPWASSTEGAVDQDLDERSVQWRTRIQPALERACYPCHGAERQDGGLRLDSLVQARGGGNSGKPAIEPGDAHASEALRRVMLPREDADFMPPSGKQPLSGDDVLALARWIRAGAWVEGEDSVQRLGPPDPVALARLSKLGVIVTVLGHKDGRIAVDLSRSGSGWTDEIGKALEPVLDRIHEFNITGLQVLSSHWTRVAPRLTSLEVLHAARVSLGDEDLLPAGTLARLTVLNLFGTSVSDALLPRFLDHEALERIYLTGTAVTDKAVAALTKRGVEVSWQKGPLLEAR